MTVRRGHRLVARLDAIVVLANLLPQGVVRHQRLDNRRSRQAGDGETLRATEKGTTIDLAMNETVVQLDRFRGNFLPLLHKVLPFEALTVPLLARLLKPYRIGFGNPYYHRDQAAGDTRAIFRVMSGGGQTVLEHASNERGRHSQSLTLRSVFSRLDARLSACGRAGDRFTPQGL